MKEKDLYASNYSGSISNSTKNWADSRKNDPHTCGNCLEYSSTKGECRRDGSPKSARDRCGNWS
jgi:hypothetical protein